jgi:twitching motility protein PilT
MRESQLEEKLKKYLAYVIQQGASDLHLSVGDYPIIRLDGDLYRLDKEEILTKTDLASLAEVVLNEMQKKKFKENRSVDLSLATDSGDRFRVNVYYEKEDVAFALRYIPKEIRPLQELGMPDYIYNFMKKTQGLLLVTGPTGHGKSTTLAALVDYLNSNKKYHIVTIEDPIEYLHKSKLSLVNQREVYDDATNFTSALKSAFREDVDVILLGEMRDLDTISTAITAAETGHLILATLHTNDSIQTIDRIIDIFPAHQQNQIRAQLANVLLGVVSQRLLKKIGGGRVPAVEILIKNIAVENLIRQNQAHQIGTVIETSLDKGMVSINRSLARLVKQGLVEVKDAETYATDVNAFRMFLESGQM